MTQDNEDAQVIAAECIRQSEEGNYERALFLRAGEHIQRLLAELEAVGAGGVQRLAPQQAVPGDELPPVGSRVFIRHGRDDDAHACIVTGYYAWGDLGGNQSLHRLFVRLVYEGTDTANARMLCDCYPTAEAALSKAPQQAAPVQEGGEA